MEEMGFGELLMTFRTAERAGNLSTVVKIAEELFSRVDNPEKQKSVIPLEWFVRQVEAYYSNEDQANMASVVAQGRLARHLYGNQPGLYGG